ncbi:MAG: oligosaccharide flippase family protein, partial [Thermoflexales bacterium]
MSLIGVVSRKPGQNGPRPPGQISGIIRNAGWILAGKGIGGLFGLVYLGLAARALGSAGLGEFVLILSFGQAVTNIAQFQTSEVLIRFGARHLRNGSGDQFARLILFSAALDALSAMACIVIALGAVVVIGPMVKLAGEDQILAAAFATSFIFSIRGTPVGILRLLDRFDVAALSEATLPAARLLAGALCYAFAPKVAWFLASWAAAELITTAVIWIAAIQQLLRREHLKRSSRRLGLRNVVAENSGLWKFAWFMNLAST